MSSMTLYNQIRKSNRRDVEAPKLFEMPYVVRLHNKHIFGGNVHKVIFAYQRNEYFSQINVLFRISLL